MSIDRWSQFSGIAAWLAVLSGGARADTVFLELEGTVWKYRLGTGEVSVPAAGWRQSTFDDAEWAAGPSPVYYSTSSAEPPFFGGVVLSGTVLSGMQNAATSVFLRRTFLVAEPLLVAELVLEAACDDGFVAWINGVEVARFNVPDAAPRADSLAGTSVDEPVVGQAFGIADTSMLTAGENVLAVQVFNSAINSSDLGFMAALTVPTDVTPPTLEGVVPAVGVAVNALTRLEITFSEAVTGVEAGDVLINGTPAATLAGTGSGPYVFSFLQPPAGPFTVSWASGHGITDGSGIPFAGVGWSGVVDPNLIEEPPRIIEIMALNSAGLTDEDGDHSDWLEILNARPTALSLHGWHLTDTPGQPAKWRLPAVTLAPGERLVVFASGKDRREAGAPLHTNFSLSAGGEYLALVEPDGVTVASAFAPAFPRQLADRAYGAPQDSGPMVYLALPTPGAFNAPAIGAALVADAQFCPKRGLYDAPVTVTLTTQTDGASIRFTTNGTVPTAATGALYTGPLTLNRTTVLRALAYKAGSVPTNVDTHTYLFVDDALNQAPGNAAPPGWPAGSVNGQRLDYEMDSRIVNHTNPALGGAAQVRAGLLALPSLSVGLEQSDLTGAASGLYVNASQRGPAWERPATVELLNDPEHGGGFKVNAGLRIRGNFSRDGNNPKHSLRLLFRSSYGDPKLRYPLYGSGGASEFDALDVQSPQDFSWAFYEPHWCNYMRDTWARDTQGAMGQPHARSRWLHLYLNGIYWGLYQMEERPEATFGASYLGGDADAFDVIKNSGFADDFRIEATDGFLRGPVGQPTAWERLFGGCRGHFATPGEERYFALQGLGPDGIALTGDPDAVLLDPDNLADYLLMVMHSANTDMASSVWVGQKPNNFYGLRRRNGHRGFVWVAHDGETSLDYYAKTYDRTGPVNGAIRGEFDFSNPEFFHNDLLPSKAWRTRFGDRAHRALFNGGPLSPEACSGRLDARAAELTQAILPESARWGDAQRASAPYTKADWQTRVAATRSWFAGRREILITQLKADGLYPSVAAPDFSQFGGSFAPGSTLTITEPSGTTYFTIDGSDPRRPNGEVAPSALGYTSPYSLNSTTRIKARALVGTEWSALVDAAFARTQDTSHLVVNEIHYHPADDGAVAGEDLEFIELHNAGATAIDLGLMEFSRGLTFQFPAGTSLGAGAFVVVARAPAVLASRHPGLVVHGPFEGRLDDSGETLELVSATGERVAGIRYDDDLPWPTSPDGAGSSLTLHSPMADPTLPTSWRPSTTPGGTPGRSELFSRIEWRTRHFSPVELEDSTLEATLWGDAADPDGDGFPNLLEYALGTTNPKDPARVPAVTTRLMAADGTTSIQATFIAIENAPDISITAEISTDLSSASWLPLEPASVTSLGNGTSRVTAESPLNGRSRQFLRVRVRTR